MENKKTVKKEQVKIASKSIQGKTEKTVTPAKDNKTPVKKKKVVKKKTPKVVDIPKKTTLEVPLYLKKEITEFIVGTEDYRKLVEDHNKIFETMYNTWRCRPAVFYTLYDGLKKHYGLK